MNTFLSNWFTGRLGLANRPRRRLAAELLEDRRLLAAVNLANSSPMNNSLINNVEQAAQGEVPGMTLIVTTAEDELDDDPLAGGTDDLSLREAIELTNLSPGFDLIQFAPEQFSGETIDLVLGDLSIRDDLKIEGPGALHLTIDALNASRIFVVTDFLVESTLNVEITDITLTRGVALGVGTNGTGGAITSLENLTVRRSHVTGNIATTLGGGIYSSTLGSLTIEDSTIANNAAGIGGGVVMGNQSTIHQSTISGNQANTTAGGILHFTGTSTISNSTVVMNEAGDEGGGIVSAEASTHLASTLVAGNTATAGNDLFTLGGGFSGSFSLIADPDSAGGFSNGTNQNIVGESLGTDRVPIDVTTLVEPLALHGGATPTHRLVPGNPANDVGLSADATDQRGVWYERNVGAGVDIGAYERQSGDDRLLVVSTISDELDADPMGPDNVFLSLREAVQLSNDASDDFAIRFLPSLTGRIELGLGELAITDNVSIIGNGLDQTVIDANGLSRLIQMPNNGTRLSLQGIGLTGGRATNGGAILAADADIELLGVSIGGSQATVDGGALLMQSGTLSIRESRISGNLSANRGGGIVGADVQVTVSQSTVSQNASPMGVGFHTISSIADGPSPTIRISSDDKSGTNTDGIDIQSGSIRVEGASGDETFELDFVTDLLGDTLALSIDGGDGHNTLEFGNALTPTDVTGNEFLVENFAVILLANGISQSLRLDGPAIERLAPAVRSIQVAGVGNSTFEFVDQDDWRMGEPRIRNGVFLRTVVNDLGVFPLTIEAGLPFPWRNLVDEQDVTNDGETSALDALRIINELNDRDYSALDGTLTNPIDVESWPNQYFDVNGDGKVTALDALNIINFIAIPANNDGGGEAQGEPVLAFAAWLNSIADDGDETSDANVRLF
ncbi:Dockerin type I repeat protein [Planctomycetes bacterium CA13]|uniref:Dockerin type I repeat protein n=1 Tax=Novipirellula herctigrandis TaxID=2527986 RepID=A0A5C5ZBP4_9BACT|nr:Dockerin type I repeat protein [Planctomycetes bacterium CA13]